VVRHLHDAEPEARIAAVTCLGELPIDTLAAPAVSCLDDPRSPAVRKQVLISFARRPALLSEDMVLGHVFDDADKALPEVAKFVLKTRGLNDEQIVLGSKIYDSRPEVRASVIGLLKNRTDIDPVIWLLRLSHDANETVRLGAIDALAARMSPEVAQRLLEMATTDQSAAVRASAGRFRPESEKTAALPPLPGSPSLNPKAN
jgi:HEAT repeat protein